MNIANQVRLQDSCHYFFTAPGDILLTYVNSVPSPENTTWFQFIYSDNLGMHKLEVDDELNIRLEDNFLTSEPYEKISFHFPTIEMCLLIHANSPEDFFRGDSEIHISEYKKLGLLSPENYIKAKNILGDRLIGGVNLKITRNEIGITSVQSCPVNEGQIPLF